MIKKMKKLFLTYTLIAVVVTSFMSCKKNTTDANTHIQKFTIGAETYDINNAFIIENIQYNGMIYNTIVLSQSEHASSYDSVAYWVIIVFRGDFTPGTYNLDFDPQQPLAHFPMYLIADYHLSEFNLGNLLNQTNVYVADKGSFTLGIKQDQFTITTTNVYVKKLEDLNLVSPSSIDMTGMTIDSISSSPTMHYIGTIPNFDSLSLRNNRLKIMQTSMGNTFFFSWEVTMMEWLQSHLNRVWIAIISFFSMFGEKLLLILILGFLYWCYDKKLAKTVGLSVIMGLVWNTIIKNIAMRRRPYFDHEHIKILRIVEPKADIYNITAQGYSFPSGHSTNVATVFGSLAVNLRKRWMTVIAIAIPLLTGFSRVVVGAHYPTDVLVGWLLGLITVIIIHILQKRVKNTLLLYGILLITAVPGFFYCKSEDYFTAIGLLIGFMGGTLLEDRYVHFENTHKPLWMVVRVLGGVAIYFALNAVLKMPFSKEFLSCGSTSALLVRCVRYAIIAFVEFGIYPILFRLEKREEHQTNLV